MSTVMATKLIKPTDTLFHKREITGRFGDGFWDEAVNLMAMMTDYTWHELEVMWDNAIAYLLARATMRNPNDPLVINILPDTMWHSFVLHSNEYVPFCYSIAGTYLHHDPALVPNFVNSAEDTARTLELFERHSIGHHPDLWADHVHFAPQAA